MALTARRKRGSDITHRTASAYLSSSLLLHTPTRIYIHTYRHGMNWKRIGLGGIKVRDCLIKSIIILYDLLRHVNLYPTWVCSFSFCVQWNEIYVSPSIKTKPDQISSFPSLFSYPFVINATTRSYIYIYRTNQKLITLANHL